MSQFDFSTCEIADALLYFKSPHGGLIPDITLHSPTPPISDFRISGPAYTVQMVSASDQTAPELSTHFLDTAPANSIIFIDAPAYSKNAVWGRLMTAGAQAREVAGVVISGRCRDLSEHRAAGFPVFARGRSTVGESLFARPSAVNVPLVIRPQDCAECTVPFTPVTVEPGDWIFADENGVVCVPKDKLDEVIAQAAFSRECEARAIEDIKAGKGATESMILHFSVKRKENS